MGSIPWKQILLIVLVIAAVERVPAVRQIVKGA